VMMRLKSDLAEVLLAALDGTLNDVELEWDPRPTVGVVMAAGGRVLCVTAIGDSIAQAQAEVYRWLPRIGFANAYWRSDIGHLALKHEEKPAS